MHVGGEATRQVHVDREGDDIPLGGVVDINAGPHHPDVAQPVSLGERKDAKGVYIQEGEDGAARRVY